MMVDLEKLILAVSRVVDEMERQADGNGFVRIGVLPLKNLEAQLKILQIQDLSEKVTTETSTKGE